MATAALTLALPLMAAAGDGSYRVVSPDGHLSAAVVVGKEISYTVAMDEMQILNPSRVSMTMSDGTVFGADDKVRKVRRASVDQILKPVLYKKSEVRDNYNEMTLDFKEFSLVFRAYDDGVAYRFVSKLKGDFIVSGEQAEFAFCKDWNTFVPYVKQHTETLESQYYNSFENTYEHHALSKWNKERLAFLPVAVEADNGVKVLVTESDLRHYPGMFLYNEGDASTLSGRFAPYPKENEQGDHNMLQGVVKTREDYIAKCSDNEAFPWRIIMVTDNDAHLAVNDLVWLLGKPADPAEDYSWVRPGKVAWDWWNAWNIKGVDFEAGVNNDTYKYYIDFAAANHIEYVILDEGWAVKYANDLNQVVPEIDLEELVAYGRERGVGIILWAGYWPFAKDMENVCRHFSEMGIKGFKVDFMNRDDQPMVDWYRRAAEMCAKYHLLMNFHGAYKPTGLQRTYPNVVNFEGVHGLEQMKWSDPSVDQVTYDVTIPFIRMLAGPMDYTQGAMRNATKKNYKPIRTEPMSQGTRCRQLAEYVVFESPLNMMCDSPTNYMAEQECTDFIAAIPTVWDETVALDGKVAEYVVMARRKGCTWYVGAMAGWDGREMEIDLGFLPEGEYSMTVFRDGVNAHRIASDYRKVTMAVPSDRKMKIKMAPGGGWAAVITRKNQ